jgi:adenylate cyclase class 2
MAQEIEAKFYVQRLGELRRRLESLGAKLAESRILELNIRFDTPRQEFQAAGRVLRLRQDSRARLTYKDRDSVQSGALSRREIEFTVSDFDAAREFLEALGYQIALTYEKYRTTYKMDGVEIMLDEMPYGHFVEIEGAEPGLRPTAEKLGLRWEAAIRVSYSGLFDMLRTRRDLQFRDLTFENFKSIEVSADDLGVQPADGRSSLGNRAT